MKNCQKPTTSTNHVKNNPTQATGHGDAILSLCQIRAIADLFTVVLKKEQRDLSTDACTGIAVTLSGAANTIEAYIQSDEDLSPEGGAI